MAFGPATANIQQAVLALLNGREASPVAPVPLATTSGIGPLDMETTAALAALQPQPVPPALPGPVDAGAIRSRFDAMAGPEPVAPPIEPTPLIIRVARALQGFGAGVQGQGPQFLADLRETTERPQREYRAQKERYDTRKQELGVMAEQAVLTAEDRRLARTMELIDKQADRDFQKAAAASGVKNAEALERLRGVIDMERDARKAEAERKEQERRELVQKQTLAAQLTADYARLGAKGPLAKELAEYAVGLRPSLSAAGAKFESAQTRIAEAQMRRASSGGASSNNAAQQALANFNAARAAVDAAVKRGDVRSEKLHRRRLDLAYGALSKFPREIEASFDQAGNPQARMRSAPAPGAGQQQQQQQGPMVFDLNQPQASAPQLNDQQRNLFNQIKQQQPQANDAQIIEYMKKKGWLQ